MADTKTKRPMKEMIWSLIAGAVVATIIGFWGLGWTTAGGAQEIVTENAEATGKTLVASGVLTAACVANAAADSDKVKKLAALSSKTEYTRTREMANTGWADVDGVSLSSADSRKLGEQCLEALLGE